VNGPSKPSSAESRPSTSLSLVAWLAILPATPFLAVIHDAVLHNPPPAWWPLLNVLASAAFLALAHVVRGLEPIRGYLRSIALLTLGYLILLGVENMRAWRLRFEQAPAWQFVFADALLELIPCLFLTLGLARTGLTRRDVFLIRGDLSAPFRMPFHFPPGSWAWMGPVLTVILAGPLLLQLFATVRPERRLLQHALQGLPLALAFAVYNSAQEEYRFRAVLLGQLRSVVGASQALWMTAVLFGLAHWFGHPSGPAGVVMAGFAGLVWGKSMLETGGFAWAWLIHGFMDLVIFTLLLMSMGTMSGR
jgi:membrane protease YdiL (CAAX protease family)